MTREAVMKIKNLITLFVLVLTAAMMSYGQDSKDQPELRSLLNEFLAGAGRNDAAVHDRFWAEDLIYTRSAGSRIGKADLMKGVRSAPARKEGEPITDYTAEGHYRSDGLRNS